jgi:hypothetical protein
LKNKKKWMKLRREWTMLFGYVFKYFLKFLLFLLHCSIQLVSCNSSFEIWVVELNQRHGSYMMWRLCCCAFYFQSLNLHKYSYLYLGLM